MINKYGSVAIFVIAGVVLGLMPGLVLAHPAFPIGWYDKIGTYNNPNGWQWDRDANLPAGFVAEHCNVVMPYLMEASTPKDANIIAAYLNQAQTAGVKVIMQLQPSLRGNADDLTWFISRYWKNFPAVCGWYTFEEASQQTPPVPPADAVSVYRNISQYSYGYFADRNYGMSDGNKPPVFMCFTPGETTEDQPTNYKDAYDIMIGDCYPFYAGNPEFGNPSDPLTGTAYWTTAIDNFKAKADSLSKPWWPVLQGFGSSPNGKYAGGNWREPTKNETRYCMYSAILDGCRGMLFYNHQYATSSLLANVFTPLTLEFQTYADAVKNGAYSGGGVSNNTGGVVKSQIFADELHGEWYLITANRSSNNSQSSTFTVTLPHGAGSLSALPMSEGRSAITINSGTGQFTDTYTKWQVHIYKLQGYSAPTFNCADSKNRALLPGNVNGDCRVDLKDFAKVAHDWLLNQ